MTEWKYREGAEMTVVMRSQDDLYSKVLFPSMLLLVNKKL